MTCTAATNSAPNRRYSPASAAMTAIRESALLIGCVCASRLIAPARATAAKARNRIRWILSMKSFVSFQQKRLPGSVPQRIQPRTETRDALFSPCHCNCSGNQIGQRQWQQKLPAKRHQLVVTEARQRAAHPDVNKEKDKNLGHKPEHRQQSLHIPRPKQRAVPSAQEQKSSQAAYRDHVRVFRHKEHGKLHRAVFCVIASHQFRFGFREIKRDAIRLSVGCDQVTKESDELSVKNVPARNKSPEVSRLCVDNRAQAEAAGHDQNADQREPKRNLIADHLRAGAQAS